MSNYYLCDYCKYGVHNANGDITCTRWAGPMSCRGGNGRWQPKVMHDGIEKPTDVCEHYERRDTCQAGDD